MSLLDRVFSWNGSGDGGVASVPLPVAAPAVPLAVQAYDVVNLASDLLPGFMREGFASKSGRVVSERSAMGNATFNRAATLNASVVGMLPLNLHRKLPNGTIEKVDDHPVHRLLRRQPNPAQTPMQFKSYMQGRAFLKGNAYAFKVAGVRGVQALWPLDPDRVTLEQGDDFSLRYVYQPKNGGRRVFAPEDIFHLRAPWSSDGLRGEGMLKLAAEALGLADVTDEAAARLLKNGANIGGVLSHPRSLSADAQARLRSQFETRFQGSENAGRWIVAEEGMDVTPFSATGRESEGVAQRKHQTEELARLTGIPRPLLAMDDTSWGTGIEQLGLFLVTYHLLPWFIAWEEVVAQSLLTERERDTYYAKFNEAALMRGSMKDQAEFLAKALGGPGAAGFMVPNEAREKMDMNPIPGGDEPAWMQGASNAPTAV